MLSDEVVVLTEGPPWGFRLVGGSNTGSPLTISKVNFFINVNIFKVSLARHDSLCC